MADEFPDYYAILGISSTANEADVRLAYKKASLRTHPDRQPGLSEAMRKKATAEFQKVADAYYVLSDPRRRSEYDLERASRPQSSQSTSEDASASFFANFFRNAGAGAGGTGPGGFPDEDLGSETDGGEARGAGRPDADHLFGDVFEDMLRPEVHRALPVWTWTGGISGAALGFIVGNLPGAAIGGYAGNRLGAIRDAKGKAVIEVFKDLGANQRASVLKNLAMKVLGVATSA